MFGLNQLYNQFKLNSMLYCTLPVLASVPTPWPTYVLSRILLPSRASLAGTTLLQLLCSTVLCLVRSCSCRVYKQEEPQAPPQSSTCSHTENLNLKNQITTDSGVPNAAKIIRRCQDCQGPQVVIDERDQGTLSN